MIYIAHQLNSRAIAELDLRLFLNYRSKFESYYILYLMLKKNINYSTLNPINIFPFASALNNLIIWMNPFNDN